MEVTLLFAFIGKGIEPGTLTNLIIGNTGSFAEWEAGSPHHCSVR